MFWVGIALAILVFFMGRGVEESRAWIEQRVKKQTHSLWGVLRREWKLAAYAVLLMTAFNFFSHGSQDAYPNLFLKIQHVFDTKTLSLMTPIANIGPICGGIRFGFLSDRFASP